MDLYYTRFPGWNCIHNDRFYMLTCENGKTNREVNDGMAI